MQPRLIDEPARLQAAGTIPKEIEEHVGRVVSGTEDVSLALMRSPSGWSEPGQTPEFDEYTMVLTGAVVVEHTGGSFEAGPGQTVHSPAGSWVRYSTPAGAEYVSVCVPAFAPDLVHRDPHT